jgi:hypothetical protein
MRLSPTLKYKRIDHWPHVCCEMKVNDQCATSGGSFFNCLTFTDEYKAAPCRLSALFCFTAPFSRAPSSGPLRLHPTSFDQGPLEVFNRFRLTYKAFPDHHRTSMFLLPLYTPLSQLYADQHLFFKTLSQRPTARARCPFLSTSRPLLQTVLLLLRLLAQRWRPSLLGVPPSTSERV